MIKKSGADRLPVFFMHFNGKLSLFSCLYGKVGSIGYRV